jgi:hypothetical protein
MTWVKLDDTLPNHPKVDRLLERGEPLGLAALGLWALALCHCAQQLTDGKISRRALRRLAPLSSVELEHALVRAGLLDELEDGSGFQIHDYLEFNPSREQVIEQRAADRERQRKWRESRRDSPASQRDAANVTALVTGAPSRPVPYLKDSRTHGVTNGVTVLAERILPDWPQELAETALRATLSGTRRRLDDEEVRRRCERTYGHMLPEPPGAA